MTGLLLVFSLALITTCEMEVGEAEQDVALTDPYISRQPASASYFVSQTTAADWTTPTLNIEVTDWIANDGRLTYQWYTFDTIDEYVKGDAKPIDGASGALTANAATGQSTASYTPANLKTAAGSKNYYYVVVTNTNSGVNVGVQEGSVQSEVAIISFSANSDALPPVISRHPGGAGYQVGRSVNSLSVRAAARPDRTAAPRNALLSYQWYTLSIDNDGEFVLDGDGKIVRVSIPNATVASYQPNPSDLKFGKNYFYVEVISTETGIGTPARQASIPAIIEILPGSRAVAPVITTQPKDKMYFTGDPVVALKVEGESRDDGKISYQWYSTTLTYASGGTEIEGAVNSEFTPPIDTTAVTATPRYYYAVVTNTQETITSEDPEDALAVTTSKVAKVSVASAPGAAPAYNATVTVANPKSPANRYQYVRGYGGMDVAWANFPEQKTEDMHTMYNPDTGLAYNINRIMISPGYVNPSDGIADLISRHRPNYYENVKIVNNYGGYNLASPWSPPKEWKTNNSINGGGDLIPAYYRQFAEYLKAFAQDMYDHGAPIYAISISNEPNYTAGYDGCEWTPNQMRDFYKLVGRFTNGVRGYGGGKQTPVVLTVNGESANTPDINVAALSDPVSRSAIDLLCRHVYGEQTTTLWRYAPVGGTMDPASPRTSDTPNILDRGDGTKMEVWMTEHNINSANATAYPNDSTWNYVWRFMNDVDLVMRMNNENAFVWWASKRFYSMLGDGSYKTNDGVVTPRGWGLSHYAKYTIDTHRIVTTISGTLPNSATEITFERNGAHVNNNDWRNAGLDNESARITAYASITSGKDNAPINDSIGMADVEFISLVMWTPTGTNGSGGYNMGTIKIDMPTGFKIGSYTAIRSTGGASLAHVPDPTITIASDRQSAYVNLPRSNMLSVKFIKE